jgi:PKD domain
MKSKRILTRKIAGLDYRVWRVMILVFIIPAGLLGYKLMDKEKCAPIDFKIKAISDNDSVYYTNDILSFRTLAAEKNVTWDFDDKTGIVEGAFVTHRFATDGKYFIRVTVNATCEFVKPVTIKKAIVEETDSNKERITGNDKTFVRTPETFTCSQTAESYEWKVSEHPEYGTRTEATTTYKFEQPGDYTIELTLNKNRLKKYTKSIKVAGIPKLINDKPEPPPPVTGGGRPNPSKIIISESTFKEFLEKVISGVYFEDDFYKYLCAEGATPVIFNAKKNKPVSFSEACKDLQKRVSKNFTGIGKRAKKIESVKLIRDAKLCITSIEINYD